MYRVLKSHVSNYPLVAIVAAGILLRIILFDMAPVHADAGLFLYDALLTSQGNVPTLDFFSRSILFHYLLAAVLWFDFSPLISGRIFMILISAAIGILLYHLTSILHSERAGLAAAAVFLFTPFSGFWGMYIKTELGAELFVILGLILLFSHINRERMGVWVLFVVGSLLAIAFLIRLVVLVHFGTILLFVIGYRLKYLDDTIVTAGLNAVIIAVGSAVTLLGLFLLWGGPQNLSHFFDVTVLSLVQSEASAGIASNGSSVSTSPLTQLVALVCPNCGATQYQLIGEIILLTLPAMLISLVYWDSLLQKLGQSQKLRVIGYSIVAVGIILWGLYLSLVITHFEPPMSHWLASISVIASITAYIAIIRMPTISIEELWTRETTFVFLLLGFLFLAHLQRDRIFNHEYFMTFFPYVSVLAGITMIGIIDQFRNTKRILKRLLVLALAVSYIIAFTVSPFIAAPWGGLERPYSIDGPGTVSGVRDVGQDLQTRTKPGDRIFTVQPIFALEADRPVLLDLSRSYWLLTFDPESNTSQTTAAQIQTALRSGDVKYVIVERFMGTGNWSWTSLFEAHPEIKQTVMHNYCPVDTSNHSYDRYDITLYVQSSEAPNCHESSELVSELDY